MARRLAAWCLERPAGLLAGLGACPACAIAPATAAGMCRACQRRPWPARRDGDVLLLGAYAGSLGALVRAAKFDGASRLLDALGAALGRGLAREAELDERLRGAWLVPIPSHRRRRARRGPDPSERLAGVAARTCGHCRSVAALERVRVGRPQSTLAAADRERNVVDAFALRSPWQRVLRGRVVVLVDDVLTSGATARAAAGPLTGAGARVALVMVVAGPGSG